MAEVLKCPKCGDTDLIKQNDGTYKCSSCGEIVRPSLSSEGKNIASGLASTAHVASDMLNETANSLSGGNMNRKLAIIFAFAFGWLGAQFFYTKRPILGVAVLVLSIGLSFLQTAALGLGEIIGIIYGFTWLSTSDKEFAAKYDK